MGNFGNESETETFGEDGESGVGVGLVNRDWRMGKDEIVIRSWILCFPRKGLSVVDCGGLGGVREDEGRVCKKMYFGRKCTWDGGDHGRIT